MKQVTDQFITESAASNTLLLLIIKFIAIRKRLSSFVSIIINKLSVAFLCKKLKIDLIRFVWSQSSKIFSKYILLVLSRNLQIVEQFPADDVRTTA